MFKWLLELLAWVFSIWDKIPDSEKEKIIKAVVDVLESTFRNLYRSKKKDNGESNV